MNIGFWQIAIVLGVIVYIIVRISKNKPKDSRKKNSILKGIEDFKRGFNTPRSEIEKEIEAEKNWKRIAREEKQKEKERQGEEKAAASEPSGGSLTGKIARLKKLYKNGTLTKAEFEQAKNNLLK